MLNQHDDDASNINIFATWEINNSKQSLKNNAMK